MSIFNGSGKGEVINPFEAENQAARYDRCRPQYHHIPFNWIRERVGYKFSSSLDVACGTGHSTVALATISDKVVGCDLSEEMLSLAHKKGGSHLSGRMLRICLLMMRALILSISPWAFTGLSKKNFWLRSGGF